MYAAGIDLGTTASAAAVWEAGRASVVPLGARGPAPSVVLLGPDDRVLVGDEAVRGALTAPERVAEEFKRRFGSPDPLLVAGRDVTAETLMTELLRWVLTKLTAARRGELPEQLTLTVPATWQGYRRDLMRSVAEKAGMPPERTTLLPEPAAAAIFYAGREQVPSGATVGVYDFGGGTFDATVLRKTAGGFEILGTPVGSDDIGGIDIDRCLLHKVERGVGLHPRRLDRSDPDVRRGLMALRAAVVAAKEALSTSPQAVVPVRVGDVTTEVRVTRAELDADPVVQELVRRTAALLRDAVTGAGLEPAALDRVLLVGGSSRMRLVSDIVTEELGVPVATDTHPKYAICLGAAIAAGASLEAAGVPLEEVPEQEPTVAQPAAASTVTATSITLDLVSTGLADAARVPVRPAAELRRKRAPDPGEGPLVIRLGADKEYQAATRRALVLAALLLLAVVTAVIVMLSLLG